MNEDHRARHDQIVNSAVACMLLLACVPMWWWDNHWPGWLVSIINPVLIAAVSYALARWKRSSFGWVMFWAQIGIQALCFFLDLFTDIMPPPSSGPGELAGLAILCTVVWLIRVPRLHPPAPDAVSHVVHHHVFHGMPGQAARLPGRVTGEAVPGPVIHGEVTGTTAPQVTGNLPRAIEAPAARTPALGDLPGKLRALRSRGHGHQVPRAGRERAGTKE